MTGIHAAREILGLPAIEFPRETAFGAVVAHLQNRHTADFQPSNVTWGSFPVMLFLGKLGKRERRRMMAERALAAIEKFASETVMAPVG
jgi:methylenetetrahydrofolate--tRNA-(uracil-5-)-methyltransferase